ncbi:2-phospho-L-lactate transferase [Novosphingobium sp. MMS21-SN21R]|uniref:2-phospho-L-lactate transferase n=1 Tax=Novosphingobium sp. MMS21-SN21R TaxID=2969298 RepID=UPI00288884E1|nr:2-phospho-L-lactate transferase [Novosphingobium sp. MMS21-SN21R]MDT0509802.1 2-phospho-L-lactate transferase [Novosphingobium sp. MMS21-SN21R]
MSGTVVLTGGVGGAKLVLGLLNTVDPSYVTAIVNVGDDFRHLGLHISPDIDTLLYTLSGKANAAQGWGRQDETWSLLTTLKELGGEDWFLLGDHDMAVHVLRTHMLAQGQTLAEVTRHVASKWGIAATIFPASNDPVATLIDSDEDTLEFQRYFVEKRCAPAVRAVRFSGAETAAPADGVIEAIHAADAVLIAPSNPWLSVDPVLAIPGIRAALQQCSAPVVAVSPLIGGKAVKGPTAKLMGELGLAISNTAIAEHYRGLIDGLLIDEGDECDGQELSIGRTATLMSTLDDKVRVAKAALALAARLA